MVEVVFKHKQEYVEESKVTNLFIGIFTTAWARLELYNLIDLLGDSVLYVDTDSCVYVSKPGSPNPATGDFLGDLTNEITPKHGQGAYITQFLCGGPKNYAYKVSNGKTHRKIRGFTLNYKNSLILNFDSLKDIICKYVKTPVKELKKTRKNKNDANSVNITNECKITREKWTRRIVNKREVKEYQVVFDKRIVVGEGEDTIPYGFHWIPSTNSSAVSQSIPSVPDYLLYTLIHPSNSMGDQSTGANGNEITEEEPMVIEDDNSTEVEDEQMVIERDIDLMDTDDESDNDFESEHASDIEFMNDEQLSDEGEPSFYKCFDNSL